MPAPIKPWANTCRPRLWELPPPTSRSPPISMPMPTRIHGVIQLFWNAYRRKKPMPIISASAPMRLSSFPPISASHSALVREGGCGGEEAMGGAFGLAGSPADVAAYTGGFGDLTETAGGG